MAIQYSDKSMQPLNGRVVWVEAITEFSKPAIATTQDEDGNTIPHTYSTKAEIDQDIQSDLEIHQQQIKDGDRDPDDEYIGYAIKAKFENNMLHELCEKTEKVISSYDWTKQL